MTKKEPLTKKVGRKLKELYYGPKTYAKKDFSPGSGEYREQLEKVKARKNLNPAKFKKPIKKKDLLKEGKNTKEKDYIDALRQAGATDKEISKFFE